MFVLQHAQISYFINFYPHRLQMPKNVAARILFAVLHRTGKLANFGFSQCDFQILSISLKVPMKYIVPTVSIPSYGCKQPITIVFLNGQIFYNSFLPVSLPCFCCISDVVRGWRFSTWFFYHFQITFHLVCSIIPRTTET